MPPLRLLTRLVAGSMSPADVPARLEPDLTDLARQHRLGPFLLWALKRAQIDPAQWAGGDWLVESAHRAAVAYALLAECQNRVARVLAAAHIPALWIKGSALAATVYPEPALRPMCDLDVLVPFPQRHAALQSLLDHRYIIDPNASFRSNNVDIEFLKQIASHHYSLVGGRARSVSIELHFRLLSVDNDILLPLDRLPWFWERPRTFTIDDGVAGATLADEAHLVYLAAHNIYQHREAHLVGDLDVHWLIARRPPDWEIVIDQAARLGWTGTVARALERAVSLCNTPVPGPVIGRLLKSAPRAPRRARRDGVEACASAWRILSQLSPRDKLRYLCHSLAPSAGYMRWRYGISNGRSVWPYYPYRWCCQGIEVAHSLAVRLKP